MLTVSVELGRRTWMGAALRSFAKADMLSFSYENRMERVRSVNKAGLLNSPR